MILSKFNNVKKLLQSKTGGIYRSILRQELVSFSNETKSTSEHETTEPKLRENVMHIKSRECAETLSQYLINRNVHIFEANPGKGVLTETLLKRGVKHLSVLESNNAFLPHIQQLQSKFGVRDELRVYPVNILNFDKLMYQNRVGSTKYINQMFSEIPPKRWKDDPGIVIVGSLPIVKELSFLKSLSRFVCERSSLFACGRVEFLLFMSYRIYLVMTALPSSGFKYYTSLSVFYNLFFDVQHLGNEPYSSFSCKNMVSAKTEDVGYMHLVRITPKQTLAFELGENIELQEFYYFVRQSFVKRSAFIISKLENYIPNSGPRLIKLGYTTTTRFGDLKPTEVVDLFKVFSSWPEYPDSAFKSTAIQIKEDFD